jgi:hypothetical protein
MEQNGRIHNQVAELLSAYIDGEVTPRERALVEAHLATCSMCVYNLATLRQAVALLRQLPQVAAPRPFTLHESDIGLVRPSWPAGWRLPWAQGAIAVAAVLLCVVVAGGALWLGQAAMVGAPAAPAPVAFQAPAPTRAAAEEITADRGVVAKKPVAAATPTLAATEGYAGSREMAEPTASPQATPAQAAKAEKETVTGEGGPLPAAAPPLATPTPVPPGGTPASMAAAVGTPAATEAPVPGMDTQNLKQAATVTAASSLTGTLETRATAPTPVLWEVQDLSLEIEPGLIRVSGRLPVAEGLRLAARLWRDGQPTDWLTPESQQTTTGANGQFSLRLQARPDAPDFDLFAVEPASYEIRLYPVDPSVLRPGEARIPFDTYSPPPAEPTELPAESLQGGMQATPTPAPAATPSPRQEQTATRAVGGPRPANGAGNAALLFGICGVGAAILLLAGLAGIFFLRTRR